MILFEEIYKKALALFDDPKIVRAYETDQIAFCKHMYSFFNNVSIYEPVVIGQILSDVTPPKGELETIISDGVCTKYPLSIQIPLNSHVVFRANGVVSEALYNATDNTIEFAQQLPKEQEYSVEYYFPGSFSGDFSRISNIDYVVKDIEGKVKNILSRLLVIAWSESVRDMLVDIQGLLRDTDFKLTPNSQILNAKVNWVKELQTKNQAEQTQLAWRVRYSHNNGKFSR